MLAEAGGFTSFLRLESLEMMALGRFVCGPASGKTAYRQPSPRDFCPKKRKRKMQTGLDHSALQGQVMKRK
jgi:hypothetical protein